MSRMTLATTRPPTEDEADVTCIGGSFDGLRVRVERGAPGFTAPRVPAISASSDPSSVEQDVYQLVRIAAPDAAGLPRRIHVYATTDQSPAEVLRRLELGYCASTFVRQSDGR